VGDGRAGSYDSFVGFSTGKRAAVQEIEDMIMLFAAANLAAHSFAQSVRFNAT